jgi:hypothetical protein
MGWVLTSSSFVCRPLPPNVSRSRFVVCWSNRVHLLLAPAFPRASSCSQRQGRALDQYCHCQMVGVVSGDIVGVRGGRYSLR